MPPFQPRRLFAGALLGVAAAGLVACGSTGKGLIPAASAGPLQSDFEAVAEAAGQGNGDCGATQEAIAKTEQDFLALPGTVDKGLRETLRKGIANLSSRARAMCVQPVPSATVTSSTPTTSTTTTSTPTTSTTTSSTSTTQSSPTTPPSPTDTTPAPGGGTQAPGEGGGAPDNGNGNGNGEGNGVGANGAGVGNGSGNGNGNGNGQGTGQ